jgi:hypothetical protein
MVNTMKKTALIIALVVMVPLGLLAQTPDEIVKKCAAAMGGAETLKKHMDFNAEGDVNISIQAMEFSGKLNLIRKGRNSWIKVIVSFRGTDVINIQAYDGKSGWMERFGSVADQPTLDYESDLDHTLLLLLEKEAVFTKVKETEIEGRKAIGLVADYKGKKTTFYIDTETWLISEIVFKDLYYGMNQTQESVEKRIRFTNYKKFNDVLFPAVMIIYQGGRKFMEMRFDKMVFNPTVSMDIFKRPDQELDLRYREEYIN